MEKKQAEAGKGKKVQKEKAIPYLEEVPFFSYQNEIVLRNKGMDPEMIDEYIARDGYQGAAKALLEMTPEGIIEEMKRSGEISFFPRLFGSRGKKAKGPSNAVPEGSPAE